MKTCKLFAVLSLLLALAACGGSAVVQNPPPPPITKPATTAGAQFGHSGFGMTTVAATTTAQLERHSLFDRLMNAIDPQVYAAGTATISGSYSGSCDLVDGTQNAGQYMPLRNLGSDISSCQAAQWYTQPQPSFGVPVIGAGTVSTLVAYGGDCCGVATDNDGKIIIAVNGVATGLTCNIGPNKRCEDTVHTYAVNDGDKISAYFVSDGATRWGGISVIVLKQ